MTRARRTVACVAGAAMVTCVPTPAAAQQDGTRIAAMKEMAPPPLQGRLVPTFAWPALHDSTTIVSPLSLAGSVVLIDLWATWCEPCRREMPFLHEAWARFRARGLQILSVSFDGTPDPVDTFRLTAFPMPWLHVHLSRTAATDAVHLFRATQYPRTLLLNRDGIVLRADDGLRGAALLATLDSALAGTLGMPAGRMP